MDAYLASGSMRDSSTFYFNLTFELLKGCQFSCKGCHVNTNAEVAFTDESHEHLMSILTSASTSSYMPFIAFIGPTDFLVAENTVSVLSDPRVVEVLRQFKRLSFQTTYLSLSNLPVIADVLHQHYSGMELEFNILIEPEKIENEKYLSVLQQNQQYVADQMCWDTPIRSFGIMNVYDYGSTKTAQLLSDYERIHTQVDHLFETTIDFNFSLGRKDDLSSDEFKNAAETIKDMFNSTFATSNKTDYLRFSFGRITDSLIERQYNWKNGEFYYSPLLYERYASYIDPLKIPTPLGTIADFENFEQDVMMKQYSNVSDKTECGDCQYLGSCVDRGILHLMDIHNIKDCLVAKNAVNIVNSMGTLPHVT